MKFFVLVLLFVSQAFAGEQYKVVGRGIADFRTGEKLQMACVGGLVENTNERSCLTLQFLYSDRKGKERLIGPSFQIDAESDMKIRKQMAEQFKKYDLGLDNSGKYKFYLTRAIYGKGSNHRGPVGEFLLTVGAVGLPSLIGSSGVLANVSTGGMILVVLGAGLSTPIVLDVALLPITTILDLVTKKGGTYGFDVKSTKSLQDNAKMSWQFKPKRIKHKRFARILDQLGGSFTKEELCEKLENNQVDFLKGKTIHLPDGKFIRISDAWEDRAEPELSRIMVKLTENYAVRYKREAFMITVGCPQTQGVGL